MTAGTTRPPAVAGQFYPAGAQELRRHVEQALWAVGPVSGPAPKAVITPHAGYIYSGPVAASAYARLVPGRGRIERVVLLGPAHRFPLDAVAAPSVQRFATPLGDVRVDTTTRDQLVEAGRVVLSDAAHAGEHSLEVQLPFIQVALGDVAVLPLVVGTVRADAVADLLAEVWGGPETALVVSSDLSHYHDYDTAARLDRITAAAVEALTPDAIGPDRACGAFAVGGLLVAARRHGLTATTVDLRSSGDTAGPRDRVVGYGAFLVA